MSIIYDALKKVEKSFTKEPLQQKEIQKQPEPPKFNSKVFLLYALIICLGLFIGNSVFRFLGRRKARPPEAATIITPAIPESAPSLPAASLPAQVRKEVSLSLVLNGIFFSENEGYAVINNQIVKVGDTVEGATVKQIGFDEVELEFAGSTFKLNLPR